MSTLKCDIPENIKSFVSEIPFLKHAVVCGSRAYGTHRPDSDWDVRGFYVPDRRSLYSYNFSPEQTFQHVAHDLKLYSIQKFIRLVDKGSCQTVETLFAPKECCVHTSEFIEKRLDRLKENIFTKKLLKSYKGFAIGQIAQKNADEKARLHALRCVRMGIEIAKNKDVVVNRPDAAELKQLSQLSSEDFKKLFMQTCEQLNYYIEFSNFPEKMEESLLNEVCYEIINYSDSLYC